MEHPKIIFVDGPTAIGKGYFIDKLTTALAKDFPFLNVKVLKAVDWVLNKNSDTEERKYVTYSTEEDKVKEILTGHVNFISHMKKLLTCEKEQVDVIIADRSFQSFINYNLYQPDQEELRNTYIEYFRNNFEVLGLMDIPTLSVQLVSGKHTNATVDLLIQRMLLRNDGKFIDTNWVRTLVHNYSIYTTQKVMPTSYHEQITSSRADRIISDYFHDVKETVNV